MENNYYEQSNGGLATSVTVTGHNSNAKTAPAVTLAYGELSEMLLATQKAVEVLEEVLAPVLIPNLPQAIPGGVGNKETASSPFAESIRSDVARLRQLRNRIDYLAQRVEL